VPDSLVARKNAGNFAESAVFFENLSRKHLRIQLFANEFPTQTSREFFWQRRELIRAGRDEQGIWREIDSRVTAYSISSKFMCRWIKK